MFEVNRLVSDDRQAVPARAQDPLLKNAWGLAAGPATFWWVANNGTDTSTLYDGEGEKQPLEVSVAAAPTGLVFNGSTEGFVVTGGDASGTARFIFAGEEGTLTGWSPAVPPPAPSRRGFVTFTKPGAIYKGIAIASTEDGARLYVTDFHNGRVDVLDDQWNEVTLGEDAFVDPELPDGYGPFGIREVGGKIIVTYAKQDAAREDDVKGAGLGFVDAYDTRGKLLSRIASRGVLDAPWGIALAPSELGEFGGKLLIGNFGNGRIHAFDLARCGTDGCAGVGALRTTSGEAIAIDGLWALDFGKGNEMTGDTDELYFTAGPNDEAHGLFGYIERAGE